MKSEYIDIKNLQVSYDTNTVITNLNLHIPAEKMTIIVGPNGCGKSTLLKTIARILTPDKGEIWLSGEQTQVISAKKIARRVAVLPQSPMVPEGILVKELVAYGRFPYQSPMSGLKQEDHEIIIWAMQATGVAEFAEKYVSELSGGQRQRVWIAMALAQKTNMLILDEPTTYLDIANQLEILTLLRKLNRETGMSMVIVMHELNNAMKFADYLIGMKAGKIIFEGNPKEIITAERLKELYDVEVVLQSQPEKGYPICVDYEMVSKNE